MTRLPRALAWLLLRYAEPETLGMRYVAYDGGVWVEVTDRQRFQQTVHSLQESLVSGDQRQVTLVRKLDGLSRGMYRR